MDNGSQTSPSSKQVCKRTQYEDPFALHSLLSTSGSLLDNENSLFLGPLMPPLRSIEDQCEGGNSRSGSGRGGGILQPSSAPTSPQHRHSSATSPPPLSPVPLGASVSSTSSDPNFHATSLRERNAAMLNNELMADVHFVVGQPGSTQRIPAHKYVLAVGSSVFYAMFYGGLKYLYCDEIRLEPDTVLATLYAAKKYLVPHLAQQCVKFLEVSLTARNACLLLSQSRLFEEPELMTRCWEIVLFDAALSWAEAECTRHEMELTAENKRKVLGTALNLIRIPCMELGEFANGAAQSGILTLQETTDLFLHFTARNKPLVSYPVKPRQGLKKQICHRFQSSAYRSNQWRYRGRVDSINFMVDKRIFVVGYGLYGSSSGAADYNVRIELKKYGEVLAESTTKFFSDGSSNTFHVYFTHPVQVERDVYYTASAILDGAELSYFGQEGMSEVNMGALTFMFHCSSESTNGTGVQGGQIPELIFYGPSLEASDK
ncbi:BTB/POZ domain-containing protein 6-like 3 [Homarus americanus]|uniref:BTB/POZ domain-containing protein 6-like 3 n=1 Tax=Homarus americanus TaxID=6706 RepID=A0A8J5JCA4_HOMAM|nr:BTB/POZ domain-containing protein 6-like 3 [Homarus americanus]